MGSSGKNLPATWVPFLTFLVFIFLFNLSSNSVNGQKICRSYACGGRTEPVIRFPFRIRGSQPKTCGYPAFDLTCSDSNQSMTILELPSSGRFWLQEINYAKQAIRIVDPDDCLWKRLISLNLSGSPFRRGVHFVNYTTLRCSTKRPVRYPLMNAIDIKCMSNLSHRAVALPTDSLADDTLGCEVIAVAAVPDPWWVYYNSNETSYSGQREGLVLKWNKPNCADCEAKGGRCGRLQSHSSLKVGCFHFPRQRKIGLRRSVIYAVIIGVGIPAVLCGIGLACYVGGRVKRFMRRNTHVAEAGSSLTVNPQTTVIVVGLDDKTIESYPKVVLGESRRLPKPNDNPCPICLAEYQPKETLRTIPQCHHCFHADCIDEWLRTNATCPLCRTSPEPLFCAQSLP